MHSLSSVFVSFSGCAFRRDGLLSFFEIALTLKRFLIFFAVCGRNRIVYFVETVCYVCSQPLCFAWLAGHFLNVSQDKVLKNQWVFDTSLSGYVKKSTPPIDFWCFSEKSFFHDLPFIFDISKKVSKRLESEYNFHKIAKFTSPKKLLNGVGFW